MKRKCEVDVATLKSKLEQTETLYEQLLQCMDSSANTGPHNPFLELYQMAQEADKILPVYLQENYDVKKAPKSGAAHYLIDESGVVASESEQQKMRTDICALKFVRLTMRRAFVHFWLCNGHWKIDTFSSRHYPQWTSCPKDDNRAGIVKREKIDANVKLEPAIQDSMSTASSSKRPQSVAISPQAHASKKKKEAHRISSLSLSSTAVVPSTVQNHSVTLPIITPPAGTIPDKHESDHISNRDSTQALDDLIALTTDIINILSQSTAITCQPQLQVEIINPLRSLFPDAQESLPLVHPTYSSATQMSESSSIVSSTVNLVTHMENMSVSDPTNSAVPQLPLPEMPVSFMRYLSEAMHVNAVVAPVNMMVPTLTTAENKDSVVRTVSATDASKGQVKKATPALKQTIRATSKSLCRTDWCTEHPGGSNAQFETHWKKLDASVKQSYADKLTLVKIARSSATLSVPHALILPVSESGPSDAPILLDVGGNSEMVEPHTIA
ncbi:hypothetical protein C8R48DRAFT_771596 [Suillus tomentosus]|nr:hypothetical protein C8R48DRAFT_771596 [Suillus tomentosus]